LLRTKGYVVVVVDIVELASKVTMAPTFLEVCPIDSPLVVFEIHIPKASIIISICLGLKGFVVVCMQPTFLEQDNCFAFYSHWFVVVVCMQPTFLDQDNCLPQWRPYF
jgi:hypothetical protein